MVNFNGTIISEDTSFFNHRNRGFRFGDALYETLRIVNGKIYFIEDHYFTLMASIRIVRMEIPMDFTLEFFESEILKTVEANSLSNATAEVKFTVFRSEGGHYEPKTNNIDYVVEACPIDSNFFIIDKKNYEVELFKDYFVNGDMLSNLEITNKTINVIAAVFAKENNYSDCLLLNHDKKVVSAINGNLFLIKDNLIKTPPLNDGCLNAVLRKKMIEIIEKHPDYDIVEESISPFELQKADELFIGNINRGIQPITKYRKKEFEMNVAQNLVGKLNAKARLG
jgi:branched-chain amino acid aminotransferase